MSFRPAGRIRSSLWLTGFLVVLTTQRARAETEAFVGKGQRPAIQSEVALSWVRLAGAEGCPGLHEVSERVEAYLGRHALGAGSSAETLLEGAIEPQVGGGWRVRIRMLDRNGAALGHRDLLSAAADCREAVDAAALTLALMIDPTGSSGAEPSTAGPAPSTGPASPDVARTPVASPDSPRRTDSDSATPSGPALGTASPSARTASQLRLDLGVLASVNQLPAPSAGVEGGVRLLSSTRKLGLSLSASYLLPRTAEIRSGTGGRFSQAALGLSGFWSVSAESTLFAGAEFGRIFATGYGFTGPEHSTSRWSLNATVGLELAWRLGDHVGLALRPRLGVPLLRHTFEAAGADGRIQRIFRVKSLVAAFGFAVTYDL